MTTDLRPWVRRLEPLADPALAAAVLVLSLLPLLQARGCDCQPAPAWAFLLVVGECLPLAFRRRWPFAACLTTGAVSMIYGAANLADPPVFYATLVGLYSVAAHATRRQSYIAGAVAGLGLTGVVVWDRTNSNFEDFVVNGAVFATAWLLGDSARSRRERALALEARATQLERTRAAEAEAAVVAERNRIARELHDVVAHHVSLMVVQAEAGPVALQRDPRAAVESFDSISAVGKQALAEMRRLLGVLRSGDDASLAPQPGVAQLADLVAGVRSAGLDVTLDVTGSPRPVPAAVDLSAYRLVKQVGLGLVLVIAVDATLVRMLLMPAVMSLMGSVNWWAPRRLRRLHQRIGLRDDEHETQAASHSGARAIPSDQPVGAALGAEGAL